MYLPPITRRALIAKSSKADQRICNAILEKYAPNPKLRELVLDWQYRVGDDDVENRAQNDGLESRMKQVDLKGYNEWAANHDAFLLAIKPYINFLA